GLEEMRVKLTSFELDVGITYTDQKQPVPLLSFPLYREHLTLLVPEASPYGKQGSMRWADAASLPLCLRPPHRHERQITDSAFAPVDKPPVPQIESDSIVNLAFHTMNAGVPTIIPSHFARVMGAFPGTRIVNLVEPEVVREVGLIWVAGDPMLPMAKAVLTLLKKLAANGQFTKRVGVEPRLEVTGR